MYGKLKKQISGQKRKNKSERSIKTARCRPIRPEIVNIRCFVNKRAFDFFPQQRKPPSHTVRAGRGQKTPAVIRTEPSERGSGGNPRTNRERRKRAERAPFNDGAESEG